MKMRALGTTGLLVSEIGFGTWGIGGTPPGTMAYGPTDDAVSLRALACAFDRGVTFYDTAPLYGSGHSERLLAKAFDRRRDRVVIASKVGYLDQSGRQDFSVEHIRRSLFETLSRLDTDYLDLYQLHDPPPDALDERLIKALQDLQAAGHIRAFGLSARSPIEACRAISELGIRSVQANLSLVDQRALEVGLPEACRDSGAGFIGRTPLCFGFLTGEYGAHFHPQDHRARWPMEQRELWARSPALFAELLEGGQTPAQAAIRFCLSYPAVSSVIPGMLYPAHVEENTRASDLGPLTAPELERVREIYREHTFYVGPLSGTGK